MVVPALARATVVVRAMVATPVAMAVAAMVVVATVVATVAAMVVATVVVMVVVMVAAMVVVATVAATAAMVTTAAMVVVATVVARAKLTNRTTLPRKPHRLPRKPRPPAPSQRRFEPDRLLDALNAGTRIVGLLGPIATPGGANKRPGKQWFSKPNLKLEVRLFSCDRDGLRTYGAATGAIQALPSAWTMSAN